MRKVVLVILSLIMFPLGVSAIEGACSYHSGANCAMGPINSRAVCNDGWLSSVPYYDMAECIGFDSSCVSYLNGPQYLANKSAIQSELNTLKIQIDKLKSDLTFLEYEEQQAILDYYKSIEGRGVTTGGAEPHINDIHYQYYLKKISVSQSLDTAINQYNDLVTKYNGICRSYTFEEKNNICVQNFGSDYKFTGGFCVAPPPPVPVYVPAETQYAPEPTQTVKPVIIPVEQSKPTEEQTPIPVKEAGKSSEGVKRVPDERKVILTQSTTTVATSTQATTSPEISKTEGRNIPSEKSSLIKRIVSWFFSFFR